MTLHPCFQPASPQLPCHPKRAADVTRKRKKKQTLTNTISCYLQHLSPQKRRKKEKKADEHDTADEHNLLLSTTPLSPGGEEKSRWRTQSLAVYNTLCHPKKSRWRTWSLADYNTSVTRKKQKQKKLDKHDLLLSTTSLSTEKSRWWTQSLALQHLCPSKAPADEHDLLLSTTSVTGKKAADEHDLLLSTIACLQRHSPRLRRLSRLCSPPLSASQAWRHWGCCRHTWVWRCRSWCHWVASHPSVYWGRWTIHSRRDSQTWREGDHISGERNK